MRDVTWRLCHVDELAAHKRVSAVLYVWLAVLIDVLPSQIYLVTKVYNWLFPKLPNQSAVQCSAMQYRPMLL